MINCIAVDDEPRALEVIERYCHRHDMVHLLSTFREPLKAIKFLNHEKVDLVFLDINMPGINGIQLISTLPVNPMIIFTTAYHEYAVESYNLNAVDYLIKPITFERFLTALNKAMELFFLKNKAADTIDLPGSVFLKSGAQTHQVKISDVFYLEKQGNYITIYLKERKILMRENMSDIFKLFPAKEFVRVHKSYVVATKHISTIEVHQVTINGAKIPIGSTYRDDLKMKLGLV